MRWAKPMIIAVLVVPALTWLVVASARRASVYYLPLSEFWRNEEALSGRLVRVVGRAEKISVHGSVLKFSLTMRGCLPLAVEHRGPVPSLLSEGTTVVCEGRYSPKRKVFESRLLLVKCPAKYRAKFR